MYDISVAAMCASLMWTSLHNTLLERCLYVVLVPTEVAPSHPAPHQHNYLRTNMKPEQKAPSQKAAGKPIAAQFQAAAAWNSSLSYYHEYNQSHW